MKIFLLSVIVMVSTGCAVSPPSRPFPLVESDPISVRGCRPVGSYPGPYGYRYWGPPPVLGDFKYQSALMARDAGATHIFWRHDIRGIYGETRITGYAFDCNNVPIPVYQGEPSGY